MGLKDLAKSGAGNSTGKNLNIDQVGLSRKVVKQIKAQGIGQASIIVKSKNEKFNKYKGPITLTLDSKVFKLKKGDGNLVWYSHQENDEQFTELFNILEDQLPPGDKARLMLECAIEFNESDADDADDSDDSDD